LGVDPVAGVRPQGESGERNAASGPAPEVRLGLRSTRSPSPSRTYGSAVHTQRGHSRSSPPRSPPPACSPPAFPIDLVEKDLGYFEAAADEARSDRPIARAVRAQYARAIELDHGADNIHGVAKVYAST
jgi:hypothetical protein